MLDISVLNGKHLIKVTAASDQVVFVTSEGVYRLYHQQDCCEEVYLYDIDGDISDMQDTYCCCAYMSQQYNEQSEDYSKTWTFYSIQTAKGYVWLRWIGESNGYYSESVDFEKLD